jgi:long-chain acyl-CoA synthetase
VEIRAAVEEQWGNSRAVANPATDDGGLRGMIARMRRGSRAANANANLETDLQLSSLDRMELMSALEDRYQVDLDDSHFATARTVSDLETLVRGSSSATSELIFPRWAQRWPVTWIRTVVYYLLTWPATHLMAHPRIFGRENLRGLKGPVLVISNHVIYLDVGFVLAALPWRVRHRLTVAMGGERLHEMRNPPREMFFSKRWLQRLNYFLVVSLFNVFPLPKQAGFRESFRFAGELADRGWNILLFPEGDLTRDGQLQPFRGGIGLLASGLKIPVVPMRIDGAYEIREKGSFFNRPGRVRVYLGKPLEFPAGCDPHEITRTLHDAVAKLGQGI